MISPSRFRKIFKRFQTIHETESGKPLDSFRNRESFAFLWEGYKTSLPDRAMAILETRRWSASMIGKGDILAKVIEAIEIPGNNLLQWEGRHGPKSRVHLPLLNAQKGTTARRQLESLFFDLYKKKKANQAAFDGLLKLCGKRYELLAYLFFIADPDRFLPIRTTSFDKALSQLGVELRTAGNCSWENYQAFLAAMHEVQLRLQLEGITDVSLLDAHSFCWIFVRKEDPSDPVVGNVEFRMEPFSGSLHPAQLDRDWTPNDDAKNRDMSQEAEKRTAAGQIAEEIALAAEKDRLRKERRVDLADKVESVADRPGLGYDIKSFDQDETPRFIEVKNISNGDRFFLSEGEWQNSRKRRNYWFYLVSAADSPRPKVSCLLAKILQPSHLQPVQYLVRAQINK